MSEEQDSTPAPLTYVLPAAAQDVVVHDIRVTLESPPVDAEGNVLDLEIAIATADETKSRTTLIQVEGGSFIATRSVAASMSDALNVQVCVGGLTTPLFEVPWADLGTGGLSGSVSEGELPAFAGESAEEGYVAPTGTASLACSWRLQQTLPPVTTVLQRCQSLSMRYSAPSHRDQFADRLDHWVLEMEEVTKKEERAWSYPWLPPYSPHHQKGDPMTQKKWAAHKQDAAELKTLFRAQAVAVKLQVLKEQLPGCVTAQQAVSVLEAIRVFLETGDNLSQIEAGAMLRTVRNLRLPFEKLVRNVWQEGPEVVYDRSKATVEKLLAREVARRKALEKSSSASGLGGTTNGGVPMDVPKLAMAKSKSGESVRLGLLTFHGKPPEKAKAKSIFD